MKTTLSMRVAKYVADASCEQSIVYLGVNSDLPGVIKIGTTSAVVTRVKDSMTDITKRWGVKREFLIIGWYYGSYALESELHKQCYSFRVAPHLDWFTFEDVIKDIPTTNHTPITTAVYNAWKGFF